MDLLESQRLREEGVGCADAREEVRQTCEGSFPKNHAEMNAVCTVVQQHEEVKEP